MTSIGARLSRQLAWQTAVGLGLLCGGIYAATALSFAEKQQAHMQVKFAAVRDIVVSAAARGGEGEVARQVAVYAPRRLGTFVALQRADGTPVYRDGGEMAALAGARHVRRMRFDFAAPGVAGGRLQAEFLLDTADDARMLRRLALTLAAATLAGGLLAGAGALWRVRRGLAPLHALAEQTRAIAPQRLDQRLALDEPVQELEPWITQFNALMGRLEQAYQQLEAFNADVAHELRTPLAALIGHSQVALSRERPAQSLRETMSANLEELHRLSTMVNDMLFLSQADRGAAARRGAPASLAALARQVVDFHEAPLAVAGARVRIEGDVAAAVDEPLFKRALSNLLGNAIRYAPRHSTIAVRIALDGHGEVEVLVENSGADIQPDHLPRLFDRFFRADASRRDAQTHHGLGLAIVAAIARMHAGRTLAASGGGVTRVGFALPST